MNAADLDPALLRSEPSGVPAVSVLSAEMTYENGTQALQPVDLDIAEGEFVTLLGPSGYLSSRVVVMAARPGRVVEEIRIDEPFPRSADFMVTPRFSQYARRLHESLRRASEEVPL